MAAVVDHRAGTVESAKVGCGDDGCDWKYAAWVMVGSWGFNPIPAVTCNNLLVTGLYIEFPKAGFFPIPNFVLLVATLEVISGPSVGSCLFETTFNLVGYVCYFEPVNWLKV